MTKIIAVSVDHHCPSMKELATLVYLKESGEAELVDSVDETQMAMGLFISQFPFFE